MIWRLSGSRDGTIYKLETVGTDGVVARVGVGRFHWDDRDRHLERNGIPSLFMSSSLQV